MTTETITWHRVGQQLPDSDLTVLASINAQALASEAGPHEPVLTAWLDGDAWREHATGADITHAVEAWAAMPQGLQP